MEQPLFQKTIAELAPLIKSKEISPVDITKSVLNQAKDYNAQINAFISIDEEKALKAAKQAEAEISQGIYKGTLHGIPLALKDILHFENERVTFGSKIHQSFISSEDATVVSKLKKAGITFTGKLNLHEYAYGPTNNNPHYGPCRNPWNIEKIPGGSSGGSAAVVAADLTIASLGTDTAGSVRIPASACGIVGLKPTHGRVSKYGCFLLSWSLDHIGPMTKTVEDTAVLLEYIAGYDEKDPTTIDKPVENYASSLTGDIKGKVIGIEEDYFFNTVDSNVKQLVEAAILQLESLGAKVELVKIPSLKYSEYTEYITFMAESATIHRNNFMNQLDQYGSDVQHLLKFSNIPSAVDYLQGQQVRTMMIKEFATVFSQVDVLISPTLPALPPTIGDEMVTIDGKEYPALASLIRLTSPGNLVGIPAVSIPCGFSDGLPVGLQIMGAAFQEKEVLNFAYAFEKSNPQFTRKPNLKELLTN
ncbi:amidase [Alkalihalobacillus sp. BA299]|uniref:amidase n=1 Tax=Alkalihalobacillus sp. BA299 TaxID=2815938 RepID=UPI001ADBA17F|nr:amidase [Alkalihalobacillus sp. BA299]